MIEAIFWILTIPYLISANVRTELLGMLALLSK
jgi:hypothetical protein